MGIDSSSRPERSSRPNTKLLTSSGAWLLVLGLMTLALWLARDAAHEAHMALAYLLVVLGASAQQGRVVGLLVAVASFFCFNFFLLEPQYTLTVEDPLDWWVLVSFLVTGAVAAQLFHRAQRALAMAEGRAAELGRLSALGAESLSVPRAVDAVQAIVRVVRSELAVRAVQVLVFDGEDGSWSVLAADPSEGLGGPLPDDVIARLRLGQPSGLDADGSVRPAPPDARVPALLSGDSRPASVLIPLRVRDRTVGALRLSHPDGIELTRDQMTFADTLSYYTALAVERVQLTAEVERVEALREADRLKDALLASVSHDLRTPLTTIRALANEMRDTGDERLVIIEEEAGRLNRLVTDLLDFSRIRSGIFSLEPSLNAAEDLVGSMLQQLRGVPGSDRIEVVIPPGSLLVGRFDFVHALRALVNLVENALRHSSDVEAPVEVHVFKDAETLCFAVLDRGSGVPDADRKRIFEPFQRATGNDHSGTGLGLAIALEVAEAQGGSVSYRPRTGGGSVFELRLPAEEIHELP